MARQWVFLVGFMGSGKSTWGRKIATRLDANFVDLDRLIELESGQSIPEMFAAYGESGFREREAEILRALPSKSGNYSDSKPTIVATGGGTPCFHQNMSWMNEHGVTVYLNLSPRALWDRLRHSDPAKRPLISKFDESQLLHYIEEKSKERAPFYNNATFVVDPHKSSVADVAKMVELSTKTNEK